MSIRAFIIFIFGSNLNVSDLVLGEVPSAGSLGRRFPNTAQGSCTLLQDTFYTLVLQFREGPMLACFKNNLWW